MDDLVGFFSGIDQVRFTKGGTFIDRLSYKYTPMLLGLGAIVMILFQFGAEFSISCWCPAQFTDAMVEYTNRKCWTARTYHVPFTSADVPRDQAQLEYISYYQFVPAILFLQSFMMFIPSQIWRSVSILSGLNVCKIVDKALRYDEAEDMDERSGIVTDIVDRLKCSDEDKALGGWQRFKRKFRRNSLPFTYMLTKIIYLLNAIWQMKFTNWMLGGDGMLSYVGMVIHEVASTGIWPESVRFPLVTLCDFSMRVLHNIQDYTVQCTLPLNFYHDKLFVCVWIWLMVVAAITLCDLVFWLVWLLLDVVPTMLKGSHRRDGNDNFKKFMFSEFGANGMFVKRMMMKNVGPFASYSIINGIQKEIREEDEAGGEGVENAMMMKEKEFAAN